MTKLRLFNDYKEEDDLLARYVTELFDGRSELNILEAGCGQHWPMQLDSVKYRLTGVDLDAEALRYRVDVSKDLNEAIVADLRSVDLGSRKFDVIYNAFVLEHVENAALVLQNFSRWLRPRGLLILKLPDRNSVFGFLTNVTPFWFHVFYHKYVLGHANAGKPGYGPYPTHYDHVVSRDGIRDFCKQEGFTIKEERGLGAYVIETNARARVIRMLAIVVSALSIGRLPWKHNNLTYVLQKD
jgi:2-polyprenyl-3-methyl-5-hydroxy-6-metoxy-1,4-benzoquinol methylase